MFDLSVMGRSSKYLQ